MLKSHWWRKFSVKETEKDLECEDGQALMPAWRHHPPGWPRSPNQGQNMSHWIALHIWEAEGGSRVPFWHRTQHPPPCTPRHWPRRAGAAPSPPGWAAAGKPHRRGNPTASWTSAGPGSACTPPAGQKEAMKHLLLIGMANLTFCYGYRQPVNVSVWVMVGLQCWTKITDLMRMALTQCVYRHCTCSTLSYTSCQPMYINQCIYNFAATPGWENKTSIAYSPTLQHHSVIFSAGLHTSLSLVQTICQKSHIDVLDWFLHLALFCKLSITTNNKDAPYSRISAIQLIYNQWDSFQANGIQGRLQRTMRDGGWPSTSWPMERLFSRFHACGTENKIGKGIPEERVTRVENSTENLQERRSELQDSQFMHWIWLPKDRDKPDYP